MFHGLGPELDKPEVSDLLREAAQQLAGRSGAVVLTGADVKLPESLRPLVGPVRLPVATREEYESLLAARRPRPLRPHGHRASTLTPTDQDRLLANLKGLTLAEAEKLLTRG